MDLYPEALHTVYSAGSEVSTGLGNVVYRDYLLMVDSLRLEQRRSLDNRFTVCPRYHYGTKNPMGVGPGQCLLASPVMRYLRRALWFAVSYSAYLLSKNNNYTALGCVNQDYFFTSG